MNPQQTKCCRFPDPGGLWSDDEFLYLTFYSRQGTLALGRMRLDNFEFTPVSGFPIAISGQSQYLPRFPWNDGQGNFYFAEGKNIRRFALSTGEVSFVASLPPAIENVVGGLWGSGDSLVATDSSASVVVEINATTGDVRTVAGLAYNAPSADEEIRPMRGAAGLWRQGQFFYVIDNTHAVIHRIAADTFERSTFVSGIETPRGIWGDEQFLYVTQASKGTVLRISLETAAVETLSSGFINPGAIAGDSQYLYIDVHDRILRISKADGAPAPFFRDLSLAGVYYRYETGVWVDGNTMYVNDIESTIRRIDLTTLEFTVIRSMPDGPMWSDGRFLYIGITHRIGQIDLVTGDAGMITGLPGGGFVDGPAGVGLVFNAQGAWADSHYVYFVDDSLRRFDRATGEITTVAGRAVRLSEGTIPPEQFGIRTFTGGGDGFLYAISGYAVYKISLATREITFLAGAFNEQGVKDAIGGEARFYAPGYLFKLGRYLYVTDNTQRIPDPNLRRIDLETLDVTSPFPRMQHPSEPRFFPLTPTGLWGSGNYLYFTAFTFAPVETGVYRMDATTGQIVPFADGFDGMGIWGDGVNVYVTTYSGTIRKINIATRQVSILAGVPLGVTDPIVDGTGSAARFTTPRGIWGDGLQLYVTDRSTVRIVHPTTGETRTIAGDPVIFGTENGVGIHAHFTVAINGIWGDGNYLYVGDRAIRRITVSAPISGAVSFAVRSGGGDYWRSSVPAEPLEIAYGRLQTDGGSASTDGVVVFSFRSQGVLVSEASVPASPLMQSGRVYAETTDTLRTGIAIANPNNTPATISFYFTDAEGVNFGSGTTIIPANQQIAAFLNEAPFGGTTAARSFTFASSVPVGAITLRGYLNERSDFLMTTLPVAPDSSGSSAPSVLAHFAAGGGWTTQILLVNPTNALISGTVEMDTTTSYVIPPRSAAKVISSANGSEIRTGIVRITPLLGSRAPVASSVFSFFVNGVTVTETGITAADAAPSFRVFAEFDADHEMRTGVAVANAGTLPTNVRFELLNLEGEPTSVAGTATIGASGHLALFLNELPGFASLPPSFRGVLRVSAGSPISAIGLRGRYNERGDFLISTTPALGDDAGATSLERVFPHIVTGGGYTTEFLLLSRGGGASGMVMLRSQAGKDLPLPIIK